MQRIDDRSRIDRGCNEAIAPGAILIGIHHRVDQSSDRRHNRHRAVGHGLHLGQPAWFESTRHQQQVGGRDIDGGSPMWTSRSRRRHLERLRVPLAVAKEAGNALGGSINDFFMTGAVIGILEHHKRYDIEVEWTPKTVIAGTDPQLERAIVEIKKEMENYRGIKKLKKSPPNPNRSSCRRLAADIFQSTTMSTTLRQIFRLSGTINRDPGGSHWKAPTSRASRHGRLKVLSRASPNTT